MFQAWLEEIPAEERDRLLGKLADAVVKRKLEVPAIIFLECHKPLSTIGAQASIFFAPFLVPIVGYENLRDYGRLLQDRENIERLIQMIETQRIQKPGKEAAADVTGPSSGII